MTGGSTPAARSCAELFLGAHFQLSHPHCRRNSLEPYLACASLLTLRPSPVHVRRGVASSCRSSAAPAHLARNTSAARTRGPSNSIAYTALLNTHIKTIIAASVRAAQSWPKSCQSWRNWGKLGCVWANIGRRHPISGYIWSGPNSAEIGPHLVENSAEIGPHLADSAQTVIDFGQGLAEGGRTSCHLVAPGPQSGRKRPHSARNRTTEGGRM